MLAVAALALFVGAAATSRHALGNGVLAAAAHRGRAADDAAALSALDRRFGAPPALEAAAAGDADAAHDAEAEAAFRALAADAEDGEAAFASELRLPGNDPAAGVDVVRQSPGTHLAVDAEAGRGVMAPIFAVQQGAREADGGSAAEASGSGDHALAPPLSLQAARARFFHGRSVTADRAVPRHAGGLHAGQLPRAPPSIGAVGLPRAPTSPTSSDADRGTLPGDIAAEAPLTDAAPYDGAPPPASSYNGRVRWRNGVAPAPQVAAHTTASGSRTSGGGSSTHTDDRNGAAASPADGETAVAMQAAVDAQVAAIVQRGLAAASSGGAAQTAAASAAVSLAGRPWMQALHAAFAPLEAHDRAKAVAGMHDRVRGALSAVMAAASRGGSAAASSADAEAMAPCPDSAQKRATTVLMLAVVVPPAAHFYYEYHVLGVVQLLLYLLLLLPLVLSCGYYCAPPPKPSTPAAGSRFYPWQDALGETLRAMDQRRRVLWYALVGAVAVLLVLLAWQLALVIRIVTGDFLPASGCTPVPL